MTWTVAGEQCRDYKQSSLLEWILPNGIGGYAMGTVAGANTRRYHGLLVAAVHPPAERMVLLANVEAYVVVRGQSYPLSTNEYVGAVHPEGNLHLQRFQVGDAAEWTFQAGSAEIVKRVTISPGRNEVQIEYKNLGDEPVQLSLRPLVCHKFYHDNFRVADFYPEFLLFPEDHTIASHRNVKLVIHHPEAERVPTTGWFYRFLAQREADRGLDPLDDLFCPCELKYILGAGESVTLTAGVEEEREPMARPAHHSDPLQDAANLFYARGGGRQTIIAGYPWFSDWGRDTMIALPGLTMATGRLEEAKQILQSYAAEMRGGLIPNRFDDKGGEPIYNTVDATLWFAHAIHQILLLEWDADFAAEALGWLERVSEHHHEGTLYGIQVDDADGLLSQGEPGVQLTWMDAKVGEWVVTPRHGKPVEVNGLWINMLRVMEWLCSRLGKDGLKHRLAAEKAESNFERAFWRESLGHYLDTADPDDALLRPNQVIAMGLPFSPCLVENVAKAVEKVRLELVTPRGLRSLGLMQPGYTGRFEGDMLQRDSAYHQGTAWPWLLGFYAAACLRLGHGRGYVEEAMSDVDLMLNECGIGGIAEVYDGDHPQRPGGCPWQAWSIGEIIRARRLLEQA